MIIIPAINEDNFEGVLAKIKKSEEFMPRDGWVQIDVVDGVFSARRGFNEPEDLRKLNTHFGVELHLMVGDLAPVQNDWLDALYHAKTGPKRAIAHLEVLRDPASFIDECSKRDIMTGLALRPETSGELAVPFLKDFPLVQVLSVVPGISGQKFQLEMLDKIRFLRSKSKDVIIEIDGGVNLEVAKWVRDAGADIVVASSYLFGSPSPMNAYSDVASL